MTPRAAPTRAWGKRQRRRALFATLGGLVFLASCGVVLIPQFMHWSNPHGPAGAALDRLRPNERLRMCRAYDPGTPLGTPIDWRYPSYFAIVDDDLAYLGVTHSDSEVRRLCEDNFARGSVVYRVWAMTTSRRAGLWACTSVEWAGECFVDDMLMCRGLTPWDDDPSPEPYDRVRSEFWRLEPSLPRPKDVVSLSAQRYWRTREPNLSGYLLNAATLLGLAMFLWCAPLTIRDAWRAWRFRSVTACKSCGYDLRGLAPNTAVCPECGAPHIACA